MDPSRRVFLSGTLATGLGMTLTPQAGAQQVEQYESLCSKFSMTDLLTLYIQRLDYVMSDVFSKLFVSVSLSLDECKQKFEQLYKLTKRLEAELRERCLSETVSQAVELQKLADTGRNNLNLPQALAAASPQTLPRLLYETHSLTQQICQKAQDLLPLGEAKLSVAATNTLRQIIALVMRDDYRQFYEDLSKHSYTAEAREVVKKKDEARQNLEEAREQMAIVENPFETGERLAEREKAIINLRAAIGALKFIVEKNRNKPDVKLSLLDIQTFNGLPDIMLASPPITEQQIEAQQGPGAEAEQQLTTLDTLLLSLSGAIRVICGANTALCAAGKQGRTFAPEEDEKRAVFKTVADVRYSIPQGSFSLGIIRALKHCGIVSPGNIRACRNLIYGVRTLPLGRQTALRVGVRADLAIGTIVCKKNHNVNGFINELIALI